MTNHEKLLEALKAIAFSDITDYVDFGPDGLKPKRLEDIDPVKLLALKTYRVNKTGKVICICLHDSNKALAMLLKISGGQKRSST